MPHTTYLIPCSFAANHQEPKARADAPQTAPTGGAQAPTTAGTQQNGDPNNPAQANKKLPNQDPCGGGMLWMMPLFLVLMYFFMIRPEQKRRKEQQDLLASIKVGDRVVTLSGLHGTVSALTDKTVTLRVDTVDMEHDRSAVARIVRDDAAGTSS